MMLKTKKLITDIKFLSKKGSSNLDINKLQNARGYINGYWKKLERYHPKDDESLIGLPHPYLVPAYEKGHEFDFNEMYYWDSYFMVQGMLDKEHKEFVVGILENLVYLFEKYKIIPNASRMYLTGRSQPPLLTSFIFDVYDAYEMSDKWLASKMAVAQEEYQTVWMGAVKPNARQVHAGLSRYYDINYLHDLAEAESGWDMNPRFSRKCLNYLPVDLNAMLYKYETDFARTSAIIGKTSEAKKWQQAAAQRKKTVNQLMWSDLRGFYFDYNYVKNNRSLVGSLAGFFPLWAGMVDDQKAAKLLKGLKKFEQKGGLATTDAPTMASKLPGAVPTQWAYPNGWAPLHFIVVKGLQRYGYHDEAKRVALKWITTNLDWYGKHGVFLEKYNVVQPGKPPMKGVYPSQTGFGWTNAIFERFCQDFVDRD